MLLNFAVVRSFPETSNLPRGYKQFLTFLQAGVYWPGSIPVIWLSLSSLRRLNVSAFFLIELVAAYVLGNLTLFLFSATKPIQPATTARNPSESVWDTIQSSSPNIRINQTCQLRYAFNLHLHRLIIPRHLGLHRSSHRQPLPLHRRFLTRQPVCRALTPRPSIRCPHLPIPVRLIRHCEVSIPVPEATIPFRGRLTLHHDPPRRLLPVSMRSSEA